MKFTNIWELHIIVDQSILKPTIISSPYPPPPSPLEGCISCHTDFELGYVTCFINGMWAGNDGGSTSSIGLRDIACFLIVFIFLPSQKNSGEKKRLRRETHTATLNPTHSLQPSPAYVNQCPANLGTYKWETMNNSNEVMNNSNN